MIKAKEKKSWIEREIKKDESFLQWLAETLNVRNNPDQIKALKEKLRKPNNINKVSETNLRGLLDHYEDELLKGILSSIEGITEEEFRVLKGRQSSRIYRQKTKDKKLTTDISYEALQKLSAIKGKYSLKDTIEIMIEYIYEGQTYRPTEDLSKSRTIPLLDTIPNTLTAKLGASLEYIQAQISNQAKFEALERTAITQRKSIESLREIVESLKIQISNKLENKPAS
ncbi:hypothetical protein [Aquipseudomonas alcaligenes]|uniref:hypothetical protein n=1 Tax=Aquipseudomonas alcaligenes TaxID=43263 RepID=UPI0016593CD9|nr:hypothetical protein [Pseudomonas alcaligenes]